MSGANAFIPTTKYSLRSCAARPAIPSWLPALSSIAFAVENWHKPTEIYLGHGTMCLRRLKCPC